MKKILATLVALTGFAALAPAAHADRWHYLIEQRMERQNDLIRDGIRSGLLTRWEARSLFFEQRGIKRMVYRFQADGRLSRHERHVIRIRQDRAGQHIYALRSNDERRRPYWGRPGWRTSGLYR
jgi:hypothetical protein